MAKNKISQPQQQQQQSESSSTISVQNPLAVSGNGTYFSVSSLDGQLFVWDTLSSELVAQYTPSAHLSATCVRISWPDSNVTRRSKSSNYSSSPTKRRKKLKTESSSPAKLEIQDQVEKLSLCALGTENGTILLYSVTKNELHSQLIGHSDRVNDISWYPASDSIFSCSNDNYIIEWRISNSKIKSKQILDRSTISAICALDSQNLLTASNSIKWWNWQTKQLLKTFNGHSTEVNFLKPILFSDSLFNNNNKSCDEPNQIDAEEDDGEDRHCSYFISSAISDRYLNAWQLDSKSSENNSVASFALDDAPISLELAYSSPSNSAYLLTISRTGFLYIFEHCFAASSRKSNGFVKSPILPKIKLQINVLNRNSAIRSTRKSSAMVGFRQLPFLCAHLNSESLLASTSSATNSQLQQNVLFMIGYGSSIRPTFERISFGDCEKIFEKQDGVIERTSDQVHPDRMPKPTLVDKTSNSKIRLAANSDSKNENVTVIGPAGLIPNQPLFNGNSKIANGDVDSIDVDDEDDEEDINNNSNNNNNRSRNSPIKKRNVKDNEDEIIEVVEIDSKQEDEEELTLGEKLNNLKNSSNKSQNNLVDNLPNSNKRKRKQKSLVSVKDLAENEKSHANTDSLVNVLIQGLQSQDKTMLNTVLNGEKGDLSADSEYEQLVRNTIRKLPVEFVPALLVELQRGLFKNGEHQTTYLKWISLVMQIKISYLMTMPNISREFLALKQLLSARTSILERCYQLKGRLDIMLSQVKSDKRTDRLTRTNPKLSYESESSESSELDDDEDDEEQDEADEENEDFDNLDNLIDDDDGDDDQDDDSDELSDEEMFESAIDSTATDNKNRQDSGDDSADDEETDDSDDD